MSHTQQAQPHELAIVLTCAVVIVLGVLAAVVRQGCVPLPAPAGKEIVR